MAAPSAVSVWLGSDDGTFQSTGLPVSTGDSYFCQNYEQGCVNGRSIAVADLNGDGHLDIVSVNTIGRTIAMLLGKGDGTLAQPALYPAGDGPVAVTAGEVLPAKLVSPA